MSKNTRRRTVGVIAGLAAITLVAAGCGSDTADDAASSVVESAQTVVSSATSETPSTPVSTSTTSATSSNVAEAGEVTLTGVNGHKVTLTGPIAAKYSAATAAQKKNLGKPLDGDHNAGTRDSGVVFQQFKGGVIVAENDDSGTPAYITWGKIRDAWNVERDANGKPVSDASGKNGSAGPLGIPTSDEETVGDLKVTTFSHGKVTFNSRTGKVTVIVNGKQVPSGL